ncbi:AMP-binding protein [Sedimentitalea todarodis]|uniref:AMP-binding protein n=1 Tax=Sedimentitalea todarodis TaxID=1631240 RepID=A0ABU3VKM2_9RHOB|nr:AMP-binding protein [Sedimentitalea todarodis]MDU9006690.1 AMP-binding protein [Sedimentitalea todarodis]
MQPDGPRALNSADAACGGILECATSGTSGSPKYIRRSHLSWIASFEVNARLFEVSPEDTYAVLGALSHSLSLYGVLEAGHVGADVCMLAGLRPDRQLGQLNERSVTMLYATPTQLESLIAAGPEFRLARIRRVLVGGGAFRPALAEKCHGLFPHATLTPFYGASETSFITMADDQRPAGSVGKAYPGVEIAIRSNRGQATHELGEIWVRSPYLFCGYADPVASDTRDQDGFVTVGEFGRMDDDGNLFIAGRKSRMVTISDQNVFPDEIENFLAAHYAAGQLAVVSVPDAKRGHSLAVVATAGNGKAALETAMKRCRKAHGAHRTPRHVFFVESLPQLASGKPDYVQITAWLEDQL